MINGEIDLSIGAVYLISPFIFYKLATNGVPLVPAVILSLLISGLIGFDQRLLRRRRWHLVVRGHASGCCSRSTA